MAGHDGTSEGTWEGRMPEASLRDPSSGISRRTLVRAGLGTIAAPAVLRIIPANAQSRVIKIGHVSPKTGPLAGFGEADAFILEQVRGILAKGVQSGGRTYQVQIVSKDSQSSGTRASEVASELILRDTITRRRSCCWAPSLRIAMRAGIDGMRPRPPRRLIAPLD